MMERKAAGLYSLEEDIGRGLGAAQRGLSALSKVCLDVRRNEDIAAVQGPLICGLFSVVTTRLYAMRTCTCSTPPFLMPLANVDSAMRLR